MVGDTFPLFRNRGRDFSDVTGAAGIARATAGLTAWGNGIFDFDNDGHKDLFAACASILDNSEEIDHLPAKLPNLVLRNVGSESGKLRFADVSKDAGPSFQAAAHRGAAFGDLNNDGKMDFVVVVQNARPEIWINRSDNIVNWRASLACERKSALAAGTSACATSASRKCRNSSGELKLATAR